MHFDVYTDGGMLTNHLDIPPAWGFIIPGLHPEGYFKMNPKWWFQKSGSVEGGTVNSAEIMAAAFAFEFFAEAEFLSHIKSLAVYIDCPRPFEALNDGLLDKWASSGWKLSSNSKRRKRAKTCRELSEKEAWIYLYAQRERLRSRNIKIIPVKVKSHSGNYWNEKCDRLVKWQLFQNANEKIIA